MTETLQPTLGAPPGFPYEEKRTAGRLGFNRDEARTFRQERLREGVDFTIHKKRVYLSAGAADRLFHLAGLAITKAPPRSNTGDPDGLKKAPTKPSEIRQLRVVKATLANPHMLSACGAEDPLDQPTALLRVRVRSIENFVRDMVIPCRPVEGYTDLFDLARPAPRKKGKW